MESNSHPESTACFSMTVMSTWEQVQAVGILRPYYVP